MADYYAHVEGGQILSVNHRRGARFRSWTPGPDATDADYRAHALWPITGTRPAGVAWQRVTGPTLSANTETQTVERIYTTTNFTLAERKTTMKEQATARFRTERNAGTTIIIGANSYAISTITDAQVEFRENLDKIRSTDPTGTVDITTRAGDKITLTDKIAEAIITAIQEHVAACEERETTLHIAISSAKATAALDKIDIGAGWPDLSFDVRNHTTMASIDEDRRSKTVAGLRLKIAARPEETTEQQEIKAILTGLLDLKQ